MQGIVTATVVAEVAQASRSHFRRTIAGRTSKAGVWQEMGVLTGVAMEATPETYGAKVQDWVARSPADVRNP
jgi:hypothetical protein